MFAMATKLQSFRECELLLPETNPHHSLCELTLARVLLVLEWYVTKQLYDFGLVAQIIAV